MRGESSLLSIGDVCRGLSVDGRRVSETRRDRSMKHRGVGGGVGVLGDVSGRWDVDAEVRALTEDGTTRTLFVGDSERIGLEARNAAGV